MPPCKSLGIEDHAACDAAYCDCPGHLDLNPGDVRQLPMPDRLRLKQHRAQINRANVYIDRGEKPWYPSQNLNK